MSEVLVADAYGVEGPALINGFLEEAPVRAKLYHLTWPPFSEPADRFLA